MNFIEILIVYCKKFINFVVFFFSLPGVKRVAWPPPPESQNNTEQGSAGDYQQQPEVC
jgi:hypothetical protein